ncbi:gastric inhibitory polypeptide [Sarotherodon galilaeus]
MIGEHETGLCGVCQEEEETVEHVILRCKGYDVERKVLQNRLRERGIAEFNLKSVLEGSRAQRRRSAREDIAKGCVLSLLLFSLLTHDCMARFSTNHTVKFADNTTVIGGETKRLDTASTGRPQKRKAGGEAWLNMFPNQLHSKPKTRKYGEAYLPFGFTCTSAEVGLPCRIGFPCGSSAGLSKSGTNSIPQLFMFLNPFCTERHFLKNVLIAMLNIITQEKTTTRKIITP